jgi:hypothetical protein
LKARYAKIGAAESSARSSSALGESDCFKRKVSDAAKTDCARTPVLQSRLPVATRSQLPKSDPATIYIVQLFT